jgi:hypothetical protein
MLRGFFITSYESSFIMAFSSTFCWFILPYCPYNIFGLGIKKATSEDAALLHTF